MLPDGVVRTPMGLYVLRDDALLSRTFEREGRLDTARNVLEIMSFAHRIPEGGIVVDAGAFVRDHAVSYSQIVGAAGRVYAFEPHPVAYVALRLNVERLCNVETFPFGLSDRAGREGFSTEENAAGSFFSDAGASSVEVRALDGFLSSRIARCDFIHLDAEGYESRILRGAKELIACFHPLMLVEICDRQLRRAESSEAELMRMLGEMGYRMTTVPSHKDPALRDDLCVWEGP